MPSARVRVRVRALVLLAVFVFAAPTALAEPPEVVPIEVPPVVTPNDVPAVIARPAAPIELVETGGGYAAAGGVKARVEPAARTFPATATEEVAARTEYSTLVANPDGTFSQTVSLGRINYQDKAGAWQPIDVSLVSRLVDDYELGTRANDVDLRIAKELGADHMVELAAGDYRVRIRVPGLASGTVSGGADRLTFNGVGTDPGFEILPTPEGFRFQVVIADAGQAATSKVVVQTVGLVPEPTPEGAIFLVTPGGETVGLISAPTVIDAAGEIAPAEAVTTTVTDPGAGAVVRDDLPALEPSTSEPNPDAAAGLAPELNVVRVGEVVVTYAIDEAWLAAKERAFPVLIDPSVCIAYGSGTGCQGATGTRDVWITSGQPNLSPTSGPLRAGYVDPTYGMTRAEMYFPDVALADGAVVTSATLQVTTQGGYGDRTLRVAPLTQPWPFGNGTWNNQPAHDTTAALSFTPPGAAGAMTMDISPIVRGWYSRNVATWKPNSGLKLYLANETSPCSAGQSCYRIYFYALDGTASQRPKLTINYSVHQARVDFDTALGADFAPATMPAGGTIHLPLTVKNSGSGFTFTKCATGVTTNCYKVGYRWFDSLGKSMTFTGSSGTADLPANLASGGTSATIDLAVTAPPNPGQYTIRLDLMWMWNGAAAGASDYADPSKYYARAKDPLATSSNVRWVGSSALARSEFPIAVVAGGGTGVGETKTVGLPDGSSLGVNLWSKNLRFEGSGGVGFADLGTSVDLSYYYDSAFRTDCTSSILGACGWGTNFDEGFLPGVNGADWIYRDPDGNRFAVDATPDGQLVSGAGVRLDRYRATLVDDNNLSGWSGGTVTRTTSSPYVGASSLSISTSATASTTYGFRPVDASHYVLGSWAVKASGATGAGIGFHVKKESTGTSGWLYYTVGTDFAISGVTKIALGGSVASWNQTFQRNVLGDLAANGFGSAYDHYLIDGLQVRGNGTAGTAWFDAVRFEGRGSQIYSDLGGGQPAWTANAGNATASTSDKVAGANSIKIAPTTIALSATCGGCLAGDMNAYPYLRWAWKKVGGTTIAYVVNLKNLRTLATGTLTYYAGATAPAGAVNPMQVSASIPDHWIYVTRNLLEDARSVLGWYDDHDTSGTSTGPSGGPTPDDVQITGYVLVAADGAYGLFDDSSIRTLPDTGDDWGTTTGDEFGATYRGGSVHRFDREGRLTAIRDLDGNATVLAWTYATDGLSEALAQIIAPADGDPLSSGSAQRELIISSQAAGTTYVRFSESLGVAARYTEFSRTLGGNLTAVIPARRSAACAGTGASGCLEFTYNTGSYLARVDDPRDTGTNSFRTSITWTSGAPDVITALATGAGPLFRVNSWDADGGWRLRPRYQDANGVASGTYGYSRYDDLSPNGSVLVEYAPVACTSANCGAAPAPVDKLVEYLVDGIDNYSTEIRNRTTGNANPVTTRRGTFAAAKVDNFADPLTAGLTAWTQSADQYAASVAASNPDLYRTTYTYNEFGQVTNASTPFTNPAGGTSTQTALTVYDAEGHVIQASDAAFLANPGFEGQLAGWSGTGTWTQTAPATGVGALQLTSTQTEYQAALLVPGETFRFQAAVKAATGNSAGYKIDYEKPGGAYFALLPLTLQTGTAWSSVSYDVTIPQDGTGRIKLTFSVGNGAGTAYVDDVAVFTRYAGTSYLTNGLVDAETDVLGRVTKYAYAATLIHPAIFPTTVTRNWISGQSATADRNVASTAVFDAWGRTTTATDPDGVALDTVYAANMTDVATTRDGLDNATNYLYDEIGQRTSVDDPVHPAATTTYTFFGGPLDVTAPDGVITHFVYDGVGRKLTSTANYVNGGSGVSGVNNVKTVFVYDQFGNVTRTVEDYLGGLATSDIYTDATYDLFGQVVTRTVYENGTTTGPRTTSAYFNTAGRATASRGPINPTAASAPICPPSGSTKCNSVAILDMNGRATQVTDAYGTLTKTWYDFAGQPVRQIRNYVDGVYAAGSPDEDIVTATRYDPADHVVAVTDVLGRTTSTTYDNLDRIVQVTRADSSWTKTVYLPSGRVDRTSRPGASGWSDTQVGWTKRLYDGAGRQTATITDYDTTGTAQFVLTPFESGTAEGFGTGSNFFIATGATVSSSTAAATGSKSRRIVTSAATKNQGISLALAGTFKAGRTYKAVVWAKGATTGQDWALYLGYPASGLYGGVSAVSDGTWQRLEVSWTPTSDYASGVVLAFRGNREEFAANTVDVDDFQVWDTTTPTRHAPTITAYDAAGQVVATVAAPGHAGEPPQVTASAYDSAGRLTSVTVNKIAGVAASQDTNLTTQKAYDALGDLIDETDPSGVATHYAFDRTGHLLATTLNWDGVGLLVTATDNVSSKVGYNDRGEITVICAAAQVQADGCNPATGAGLTYGWRYTYDAAGHVATDTPPDNVGTDLVTTTTVYDTASGGARLTSVCEATGTGGCTSPLRHTELTYDDLGRTTQSIVYAGAGTASPKIRTTTTFDGAGQRTATATYLDGSGTASDSLTFVFDTLGRETEINRGATDVTTTTYNPDGSPATRKDHDISATALAFGYDLRGNLISTTSPLMTGSVTYAWRLDGLLDSRSWPTGSNSGTLSYDGAKRPIELAEMSGAAELAVFERTYDANGSVTSETQTLSGIDGDAGSGTQSFELDALRRVTSTTLADSGETKAYTYDANSNRVTQTEAGQLSTTLYHRTGVLRTLSVDGYTAPYVADAYGNLTTSVVPTPVAADPTAPSTPTNLVATANGRTRADLAWSASTDNVGVTSYAIYRDAVLVATVAGSATAWSDFSLSPGTTYAYTVKAVDAAANASASSSASQTTTQNGNGGSDTTAPSVPTGLAVSVATSKQLNLAWTASTDNVGVQGYRVYRDGLQIGTVPVGTTSFADTGLAGGSAHAYTVAAVDGSGNASAQSSSASNTTSLPVRQTTYAYDLADRLTGITPATGSAVTLAFDALGRHRTRVESGVTETYAYAGESPAITKITPSTGASVRSVVDATGARLAVTTSSGGFGWTLSDLHGDIAGYATATGAAVSDAVRYDPYGEVVDADTGGLPMPWGYQGRLDLAGAADTDILDFGFRPYVPDLGTFTSPDDLAGSALNPLTFNRYLYAAGNPATLVDPDGHCWGICIDFDPGAFVGDVVNNVGEFGSGFVEGAANAVVGTGQALVGAGGCAIDAGCRDAALGAAGTALTSFGNDLSHDALGTLGGVAKTVGTGAWEGVKGAVTSVKTAWDTGDFHTLGTMAGETAVGVAATVAGGAAFSALRAGAGLTGAASAAARATVGLGRSALGGAGRAVLGAGRAAVGAGRSVLTAAEGFRGRLGAAIRGGGSSRGSIVGGAEHLPPGEAPYNLTLWAREPYNRTGHYGYTPTTAQSNSVAPASFDHSPPLVQHYYEGPGGGRLPGFNLTQRERLAWASNPQSGRAATAHSQAVQGALMARYSTRMKRLHGL